LIKCFDELERLCPHIHLPFQAGSDRILKAMNRRYTRKDYLGLISSLRDIRPDIAITSDVMVGFPGETQQDFEDTLDLIKKIEFDNLYSFKYSDRQGTAAEKLPQKIEEKEKNERLALLQQTQKTITLKKNRSMEGRLVKVLVDGKSRKGGQWTSRTDTSKIVNFNCKNNILGKLVQVKIKRGFMNSLQGEYIGFPR
jgi:tRNA-2-methylthio-N6-dimethylallyladenosine synthase